MLPLCVCACVRACARVCVFTLHAGQFTLTRIWHAIEESGAGSAWTRHRWAKQLKTLFTGWCVTLCSVSSRVPKYSQNPPRKSKRDYFSIKSGVTPVLCSSLAFTTTPARAQCISRAVHECYKIDFIFKRKSFFFFFFWRLHAFFVGCFYLFFRMDLIVAMNAVAWFSSVDPNYFLAMKSVLCSFAVNGFAFYLLHGPRILAVISRGLHQHNTS